MELLLVSHKGVASGIKNAASMIIGDMAESVKVIELTADDGVEIFTEQLEQYLTGWLTESKTGLIFADLKGGTPYNKSEMILSKYNLKNQIKVVSGLNLAMVLDALFEEMPQWNLDKLIEIIENGRKGIDCLDLVTSNDEAEDE